MVLGVPILKHIRSTVEPPRTVKSQQQPPPYNGQCLISPKCSFTIYLTSPQQSPPYNSHFFADPWAAVVGRLHCTCTLAGINATGRVWMLIMDGCMAPRTADMNMFR